MGHKQAGVKVNAPVDSGIAGIVAALSAFPRVRTLESCEGEVTDAGIEQAAWVCFQYGDYWEHPWRDAAQFVRGYLGPRLALAVGDGASLSLRVTASGTTEGELRVRPGAFRETARALQALRRQLDH